MKKPENAREIIACRTARFFKDGDLVNLGIGMPTLCLDFIPDDIDVWFDSENGVIGLIGAPNEGDPVPTDVVDAGGRPSMMRVGGCCFDSFRSFGYIRGGHVDATVLGASVIEKHFTLDKNLPGPDQKASLDPTEFKAMVDAVRHVEAALGDGHKHLTASEAPNKAVARKSIVAARAIKAGEVFTADNLTTKRPGDGISPMRWYEVLGQTAKRDFAEDEKIEL